MDVVSYLMSKKYTDEALKGAGALQGEPCQIKTTEAVEGGTNITFLWKNENGEELTSIIFVKDGLNGKDGIDGTDGENGKDGATPTIGDNGHWFINGIDTGYIAAPAIVEGNENVIDEFLGEANTLKAVTAENNGQVIDIVDGKYVFVDIADSQIGQYISDVVNGAYEELDALLG